MTELDICCRRQKQRAGASLMEVQLAAGTRAHRFKKRVLDGRTLPTGWPLSVNTWSVLPSGRPQTRRAQHWSTCASPVHAASIWQRASVSEYLTILERHL